MTLDEAIIHCEEVVKENEQIAFNLATTFNRETINSKECKRCAEDHRQLAEWLKDYKRLLKESEKNTGKDIAIAFQFGMALRFAKKCDECDDCISRQMAIDAFEKFIHELGIEDEPYNYGEMVLSAKNVPPVTPQPKEGYWIDADGDNAICGCCNRLNHLYGTYCKHCGAKMHEP